jgi:EAL domain-containing protein (putative c-di-GMP-specific phosphodiesterase class I)
LRDPFVINGIEIFMTASVGISLYPWDAEDGDALLKHADIAMYTAKAAGRDGYRRYAFTDDDPLANISMAGRLRRAIDDDRGLVLHYQPIVKLDTGEMVGAEGLIRWDDDDRGLLLPGDFLPLAERVGLMGPISDWVIRTACEQASQWQASNLDLYLSINLPPAYCQPTGIHRLLKAVDEFGLRTDRLVIEITESAVMSQEWQTIEPALAELRKRGLRVAIDDFGTGHSSLGRLNRSWVSMLKIDRSFVRDLPASTHAGALVESVIQLARNLGIEPVAEGIETEDQRRFLVDRGCGLGQGFLFSPAVPLAQIEAMRRSSRRWPASSPRRPRRRPAKRSQPVGAIDPASTRRISGNRTTTHATTSSVANPPPASATVGSNRSATNPASRLPNGMTPSDVRT